MTQENKIINAKLDKNLQFKFEIIKENLGIQNDAEVLRFLISTYFSAKFEERQKAAQNEYEKALPFIKEFMEKYGDEWHALGE